MKPHVSRSPPSLDPDALANRAPRGAGILFEQPSAHRRRLPPGSSRGCYPLRGSQRRPRAQQRRHLRHRDDVQGVEGGVVVVDADRGAHVAEHLARQLVQELADDA